MRVRLKRGIKVGLALGILGFFSVAVPEVYHQALRYKILRSVGMITPTDLSLHGGTGFQVYTPNGIQVTLTNAHICNMLETPDYAIMTMRGLSLINILYKDETVDLCALQAVPGQPALSLAPRQSIKINIVGFPRLDPPRLVQGDIIAEGEVGVIVDSAFVSEECPTGTEAMQDGWGYVCVRTFWALMSDARIEPGNSGSPSTDWLGRVNGVVFAGNDTSASILNLATVRAFLHILDTKLLEEMKGNQNSNNTTGKTHRVGE